jgi:CHASE2 domain-containing sensor protein
MLQTLQITNLALRLCLELALLAALGVWAWRTVRPREARVAATVGLPLAAAVTWGAFVHGELVPSLPGLLVEVGLFAAAAAALVALRRPRIAAAFVGTVLANAGLMAMWGQ